VYPQQLAGLKGYDQILWLTGEEGQITEVGAMNLLFYWYNKKGEKELITAPLDGLVLPGVTRDSILNICKGWGIKTVERKFTINEVVETIKDGRMIEVFGAGTAAIVSPVSVISYKDVDYSIPTPENGLTKKLFDHILSIQYGETEHPYSVPLSKYL
jgi:branched-chain amino acid aminotransferase